MNTLVWTSHYLKHVVTGSAVSTSTANATGSSNSVLLGTYVGMPDYTGVEDPYSNGLTYNTDATNQFASFSSAMGQAPTLMNTYVDYRLPESQWVVNTQWAAASWASDAWAKSLIPDIGIPMAATGENADTAFKNIINGSEDAVYNGIFQTWVNQNYKTFFIRPGWEMNGNWEPWFVTPANAADFVAAFQHIATLAHNFSAANIQVVWNPNVGQTAFPTSQIYPGNQSVDVVGLDTYGAPVDSGDPPGNTSTDPNVFTVLDAINLAKGNGKPFSLPETGGVDANFATQLANTVVQSGVTVAFVNIWDVNDSSGNLSWSSASDNQPAVAAAWKNAFAAIAASNPGEGSSTGAGSVINVAPSTASVSVTSSNATINATAGNHMFFISGHADVFNLSGGAQTITDNGTGGNTFVLPAAGNGTETFNAAVFNNTDVFNLTSILAATKWNGSTSTLGSYLHTKQVSGNTELLVTSRASRYWAGTLAGTFDNQLLNLSTILAHSVT